MLNKKILKLIILCSAVFFLILFYRLIKYNVVVVDQVGQASGVQNNSISETVFEQVELKSQTEFKMLGKSIYIGSGSEPGFSLNLSLAGTSFGTEIISDYGERKFVGYINLLKQSTSTKVFSGKLLNISNKPVDVKIEFQTKKCIAESGEEKSYVLNINVENEKLVGCAEVKI